MTRGPSTQTAVLIDDHLTMSDGVDLPLHTWLADAEQPTAIIVALHGFNDYGHFFGEIGQYLGAQGITSYTYDQRGFGRTQTAGYWAGVETYTSDARDALSAVKARHPDVPVFMFGESMGGAVLLAAVGEEHSLPADGFILAAPAVWGRNTMPWYQRAALWLAVHTVPGLRLTGEGLNIQPSDNIDMLRALGRDPLYVKRTRVDALWGVVNLMDRAQEAALSFDEPSLILYGERDDVIQIEPTRKMLRSLPLADPDVRRIAVYEDGYHMLIRDLIAERIWRDIASWIGSPGSPLPSGADKNVQNFLNPDSQ